MGLCLRTTHTQQEALPTLTENIPSSACISYIIFQTLHSSGKSLKLSFEKCLLQNFCLPLHIPLWGVIMSHPALQREQQLLCHVLLSGTSLPVPTGTGYTGISSCESVPKTWMSSAWKETRKMLPSAQRDRRNQELLNWLRPRAPLAQHPILNSDQKLIPKTRVRTRQVSVVNSQYITASCTAWGIFAF